MLFRSGEVSPLYECGTNDHMLVIALTKIHPVGYRDINGVKEMLRAEVLRDKKFDELSKKLNGAASIEAAKAKGATVSTVDQVTFSAPAFIQATGASEPVKLSTVILIYCTAMRRSLQATISDV